MTLRQVIGRISHRDDERRIEMAVPCPYCCSPIGQTCVRIRGPYRGITFGGVHEARRADAERER